MREARKGSNTVAVCLNESYVPLRSNCHKTGMVNDGNDCNRSLLQES